MVKTALTVATTDHLADKSLAMKSLTVYVVCGVIAEGLAGERPHQKCRNSRRRP